MQQVDMCGELITINRTSVKYTRFFILLFFGVSTHLLSHFVARRCNGSRIMLRRCFRIVAKFVHVSDRAFSKRLRFSSVLRARYIFITCFFAYFVGARGRAYDETRVSHFDEISLRAFRFRCVSQNTADACRGELYDVLADVVRLRPNLAHL